MARLQNKEAYDNAKEKLLEAGEDAIRSTSYGQCGVNQILAAAEVPKGSFYHYFSSKEAFGIAVAQHYHEKQLAGAQRCLRDAGIAPLARVEAFFQGAREDMARREYAQGCLMCNLSTELADERPAFQAALDAHWRALAGELALCLQQVDLARIGMDHLGPDEAADWLMNAWSGALTRMKATQSDAPLDLFMRTIFKTKGPTT